MARVRPRASVVQSPSGTAADAVRVAVTGDTALSLGCLVLVLTSIVDTVLLALFGPTPIPLFNRIPSDPAAPKTQLSGSPAEMENAA